MSRTAGPAPPMPDGDKSLYDSAGVLQIHGFRGFLRIVAAPAVRRGLIALFGGVTILSWPGPTSVILTFVLACVLMVAGMSDLLGVRRRHARLLEWVRSLTMVIAGAAILLLREESFRWVALALGLVLATRGLIDLQRALARRPEASRRWLVIRGVAQVLTGALAAQSPQAVVLLMVALVGISWIVAGLINLLQAFTPGNSVDSVVALRDTPQAAIDWLRRRDMGSEKRQHLVEKLMPEGSAFRLLIVRYSTMIVFSTAIATFGILAESTAVVIGAMLIAPLMTPIMATSASLLMGWRARSLRAFGLVILGTALAIGTSWICAEYAPSLVSVTANSQVLGRVSPTLLDLLVAVAAGGAGAYAVARSDLSESLPGVAIAVALVPPLAVIGVTTQAGEVALAVGAFLLFATNLVGIVLAAGVVFTLVGFSPWFHLEADPNEAKGSFGVVAVSLVLIGIPLGLSGEEIVGRLADHATVEEAVVEWLGPDSPFDPARVIIENEEVSVVIVGDGSFPEASELAGALADELDRTIRLDLRVIPEERIRTTAEPG